MRILLRSPAHDLTVDVVRDAVSLVDPVPVTPSALARLTPYELALVYDWAIREHLRASDSAVERRPRPSAGSPAARLERTLDQHREPVDQCCSPLCCPHDKRWKYGLVFP